MDPARARSGPTLLAMASLRETSTRKPTSQTTTRQASDHRRAWRSLSAGLRDELVPASYLVTLVRSQLALPAGGHCTGLLSCLEYSMATLAKARLTDSVGRVVPARGAGPLDRFHHDVGEDVLEEDRLFSARRRWPCSSRPWPWRSAARAQQAANSLADEVSVFFMTLKLETETLPAESPSRRSRPWWDWRHPRRTSRSRSTSRASPGSPRHRPVVDLDVGIKRHGRSTPSLVEDHPIKPQIAVTGHPESRSR